MTHTNTKAESCGIRHLSKVELTRPVDSQNPLEDFLRIWIPRAPSQRFPFSKLDELHYMLPNLLKNKDYAIIFSVN